MRNVFLILALVTYVYVANAEDKVQTKPQLSAEVGHAPEQTPPPIEGASSAQRDSAQESYEKYEKLSNERLVTRATVALAVITALLALFTGGLWWATYKLAKDAKASGEAQATKMSDSIKEASRAASAMEVVAKHIETTASASIQSVAALKETTAQQLRAFVSAGPDNTWVYHAEGNVDYTFFVNWQNLGRTPSRNMRIHASFEIRDTPLPADHDFDATDAIGSAFLAPGQLSAGGARRIVTIPELLDIQAGTKFFYIYGWAKYNDVFEGTPGRLTRVNYRVEVVGDPRTPIVPNVIPGRPDLRGVTFIYRLLDFGNCADDECPSELA